MNTFMTLSFQVKKSKTAKDGRFPLYIRITINGLRTEFSTSRYIDLTKWDQKSVQAKGTSEESKSINAFTNSIRVKMFEHFRLLSEKNEVVTVEMVRNAYFGVHEKGKTLIEVFEYHNLQMKNLVGIDFSEGTMERYNTALKHTKEFMLWKFHKSDIELKEFSLAFITEMEYYLKVVRKCNHNTSLKYITNLKKVVGIAVKNEWMEKNPFKNYKIQLKEVERECLTENEMQVMANKEFASQRLEQVRDIFLFSCFTGLAYADAKKLSKEHIILGIDGERWIKINRTKTDTRSSIPLLPTAQAIIEKYRDNETCQKTNCLLPVLSNQKMNDYLKELAVVCGIQKTITFHLARHTFATTVTLTNGVPIESVSKMLGHKSLRTTQHYAKIIDRKLSDDMAILKEKFAQSTTIALKKVI
jgi:site-specific recombinase XerD